MEEKKPYTTSDALKELDAYDKVVEAAKRHFRGEEPLEEDLEDNYIGGFDDEDSHPKLELDKDGNIVVTHRWSKVFEDKNSPELGDVVRVLVKLTSPKTGKEIWNGYERRPILVTEVNGDKVSGLEITHSPKYRGLSLLHTPSLERYPNETSFVNVYNYWKDCYRDQDVIYDFPAGFNSDGTPQTAAEYFPFASVKQQSSGPYIVKHEYSDNYVSRISADDWKNVKTEYERFRNSVENSDD